MIIMIIINNNNNNDNDNDDDDDDENKNNENNIHLMTAHERIICFVSQQFWCFPRHKKQTK